MMFVVLLLLAIVAAVALYPLFGGKVRVAQLKTLGLGLAALLVLLLSGGPLAWLLAALAAGLAYVARLLPVLLRHAPEWLWLWQAARRGGQGQSRRQPPPPTAAMSVVEAYQVLGLQPGASAEDIRAAYRKLMQKNHPDAGGSDYLASKINLAKKTLLPQ